uniref:Uncharacterized protein n=1 Tax=Arion vulgaris TaxID=1028688 RepID=A0A0B7AJD2_9EUPU
MFTCLRVCTECSPVCKNEQNIHLSTGVYGMFTCLQVCTECSPVSKNILSVHLSTNVY